jgi:mannose-6-phosphate isomerase-like protein (cupin superfamily)
LKENREITRKEIEQWVDSQDESLISQTDFALYQFAKSQGVEASDKVRTSILQKLKELNAHRIKQGVIDLKNPPFIDENSNLQDWLIATQDFKMPDTFENIHLEPILSNNKADMFIAWVSKMVPEEIHDNILESFLLLEGSCSCHIKDKEGNTRIVKMQAGDFITMNIGESHDIIITSEKPAKAILQWIKLAA